MPHFTLNSLQFTKLKIFMRMPHKFLKISNSVMETRESPDCGLKLTVELHTWNKSIANFHSTNNEAEEFFPLT